MADEPDPGDAMDKRLKLAVAPGGSPLADNETGELKPPETEVVIVEPPDPPAAMLSEAGDAAIEKLGDVPPPGVVTNSEKLSNTNDVLRLPFSVPIK